MANLPLANVAVLARPLIDAVAPVAINVGGCGEVDTASKRSGRTFCEKRNRPELSFAT